MSQTRTSNDLWELMPLDKPVPSKSKAPPAIPRKSPDLRAQNPARPQKPTRLQSPRPLLVKSRTGQPPARLEKPLWLRSPTVNGSSDSDEDGNGSAGPRIILIDNEGDAQEEAGPKLPPRHSRATNPSSIPASTDSDLPHKRPPLPLRSSTTVRSVESLVHENRRHLVPLVPSKPSALLLSSNDDEIGVRPSLPPRPKTTSPLVRSGIIPEHTFATERDPETSDDEPPAPPLPQRRQSGSKTIFDDALAKTSTGLNAAGSEIRKFGVTVGSKVREAGSNVQTPGFLVPMRDDFKDVGGRYKGEEGLCSRCEALNVRDFTTSAGPMRTDDTQVVWSTPLIRTIYHASWCRLCRLLLHMLALPDNDPLAHPAVGPFLPDSVRDMTMQQWLDSGLADSTDVETWPFGHGRERAEHATHVLHPTGVYVERVGTHLGTAASRYVLRSAIRGRPGGLKDVKVSLKSANRTRRKHYYDNGGANYPFHPLPCELSFSLGSADDDLPAGMVRVRLLGHGRRTEAPMTVLSSFRLRVVGGPEQNVFGSSSDVPNNRRLIKPAAVSTLSYGFTLDPRWIDPSVARLWLQDCELNHRSECSQHGWAAALKAPTFLRVVDCQDMYVKTIKDPASCRFVTLSYVWGKASMLRLLHSNHDRLTSPGGLKQQPLPLTIRCAIEVVKGMGERYLWTDALCILQEDVAEKYEGIRQMDRIYGGSLATIVAAQGKSAASGLDGIQTPEKDGTERLIAQHKAETHDGLTLIAPLQTRDHNVDSSVWNARAWTFQERLLSRRLIIFTHGQILWHCRGMICREDMTVKDSHIPYTPLQWFSLKSNSFVGQNQDYMDGSVVRSRQGNTDLVRSSTMHEYAKAVEQYSHRQLSFQNDVLNAFAGLGDIFAQALGTRLLAGLPEQHLDTALQWRPMQRLKRRHGFPSWSWAGWVGRVAYNDTFEVQRRIDGTFSEFKIKDYSEEGIRPVIRWHKQSGTGNITPVNGTGIGFPWETGGQLPREWDQGSLCSDERTGFAAPMTSGLSVDNNTARELSVTLFPPSSETHSPRLVFWTSCASWPALRLGDAINDPSDRAITTAQAPLRFQLVSREGEVEGNVLLDSADSLNGQEVLDSSGRWALLQIAEAKYFLSTGEGRDVHGCQLVAVMLVEWVEDAGSGLGNGKRVLCERRGLGRISKAGWMLAQPRIRLVALE